MADLAPPPTQWPVDELTDAQKARLEAANINPATGLATDYLNHFNEVSMLIEMTMDMPEMLEEAKDWQPRSYEAHFHASGFSETAFIIDCFNRADPELRAIFDAQVRRLNTLLLDTIKEIPQMDERARTYDLPVRVQEIQSAIGRLYGIVNGHKGMDQAAVDEEMDQGSIDDLFD